MGVARCVFPLMKQKGLLGIRPPSHRHLLLSPHPTLHAEMIVHLSPLSVCLFRSLCPLPLEANLLCFGTVVFEMLPEPIVLQCLVCSDALLRIVDEYLLEQIKKLPIELSVWWDGLLEGT